MKILKSYPQFINEEVPFVVSRNQDLPAVSMSKVNPKTAETIILNLDDEGEYPNVIRDRTHGKESHSLKHLFEFEFDYVKKLLKDSISYIRKLDDDIGLLNSKGELIDDGDPEYIDLNSYNILNLLDFINDKKYSGYKLSKEEEYLYNNVIEVMTQKYDEIIDEIIEKSEPISEQQIKNRGIIKFNGILKNSNNVFYYDIKRKIFVIEDTKLGGVSTAFKLYSTLKNDIERERFQIDDTAKQLLTRFVI